MYFLIYLWTRKKADYEKAEQYLKELLICTESRTNDKTIASSEDEFANAFVMRKSIKELLMMIICVL